MSGEQFSLVWNSFPTNLSSGLYNLLNDEQLVDVTLAAEGKILRAHKLILSVCSTYFKELFKINSCKHPIVILKDVNYHDLSAILHFMYQGKVNVKQEDLSSFLKVAETLQIKGLTRDKIEKDNRSIIEETTLGIKENQQENETVRRSFMESEALLKLDTKLESPDVIEDGRPAPMEEKASPIPENNEKLDFSCVSLSLRTSEPEPEFLNYIESLDEQKKAVTEPNSITQEILSNRLEDYREQMSNTVDEPLDYTSDIARLPKTKNEPPDYSSDIELDVECNKTTQENPTDIRDRDIRMDNNSTRNDCLLSSADLACNPINRNEPIALSHSEGSFGREYNHYENIANCNKGRRTVKGIPGSSLPLETTLRVVSELGPTLRVERGKVMRMYSCPWCLRHFTRKENLKLHVRYIHGPLESLTCKLCGNKYKNSNSLRVHSYLYHNTKGNKHGKMPIVDM